VAYAGIYSDGDVHADGGDQVAITYNTSAGGMRCLVLRCRNIRGHTLMVARWRLVMSGDLSGTVHLDLMM